MATSLHINTDHLTMHTEADVESQFLLPFITGSNYLDIPIENIHSKEYLQPTKLDKDAGKKGGYYPDFSVWYAGLPVMIVEAKGPDVAAEVGYREASLYARHLNQKFSHDSNPCQFILSTNGDITLFGYWDSEPHIKIDLKHIRPGCTELEALRSLCTGSLLQLHGINCIQKIKAERSVRPFNLAGGGALLAAKMPLNTFAADLSPVLRRYFSQSDNIEVAEKAYVSSAEITEFDRILESLLKDRLSGRSAVVKELEPKRHSEPHVEHALTSFDGERPQSGQLQIIQGSVGTGKSLFIRRYKDFLQSEALAQKTHWAFINFNDAPTDLSSAQDWLCNTFIESLIIENPTLDITSQNSLKGIFSSNIQKRKGIYDDVARSYPEQAHMLRANDLIKWQDEPCEYAKGIANYLLGGKREVLVVVMDNVDRLDLAGQLNAFQLTLWFMAQTKSFIILQMRDETFERYKNRPPLDTFRAGITFHISPPRFVDVVKKRLELSLEYLSNYAAEVQSYTLDNGFIIKYPRSSIGVFLHGLYLQIFTRRRPISRILEAIAGRDVRRALEMFVSIITSGHLSELAVLSNTLGAESIKIPEHTVLRILMRTDYKFFSENSGFITNIFNYKADWQNPDNFILVEILYLLAKKRKVVGQIGLEGYFTSRWISDQLQRLGYVPEDTIEAVNYLLHKALIDSADMNQQRVDKDNAVRITASGFIHLRTLSERLEYLYGVIIVTPISQNEVANRLAAFINNETTRGDLSGSQKIQAIEIFAQYLDYCKSQRLNRIAVPIEEETGADYIIAQVQSALTDYKDKAARVSREPNLLDLE